MSSINITGGKYNSRKIKTAEFENVKPTLSKIRQGVFNTLSSMLDIEGKVFFDLFAGSGIMSLEAVSRRMSAYAFEKDRKTALVIKSVFKEFSPAPELFFGCCIKNLAKINVQADIVYIDPPYESDLYAQALSALKQNKKLKENSIVILEHPADKIINTAGFELIKTKTYADKQITYLKQC